MGKNKKDAILICLFLAVVFIPFVYADCAEDAVACAEECEKECNQKKYDYCRTYEYSGCALDVFCDCNKCALYDSRWCPKEGYMACIGGPITSYESCIKTCQSDFEAGNDVSTCWRDCNDELGVSLIPCKDGQCAKSCTADGYEKGEWAYYIPGQGYDTCACEGEKTDVSEPPLDVTEPPLDVMESSEPQPFPEDTDTPKPGSIEDPFRGYWDYCTVENSIKDMITYWFTSEENTGRKGTVGFVKAVTDKKHIDLYRNGKYYRVSTQTPLFPGDRFRTGPNSMMKLILTNTDGTENVIYVRPNSLFEVEGTRYEDYDDSIRIVKAMGSIVATIKRRVSGKKPNFYVKTPGVVLGIRGTEFYLEYNTTTNETRLMVKEGVVEITGETIASVKTGEQILVENDILGEIEELNASEWNRITEQDWDEVGREGFFTIPAVKVLIGAIILAGGVYTFKKFSKKKRKKAK